MRQARNAPPNRKRQRPWPVRSVLRLLVLPVCLLLCPGAAAAQSIDDAMTFEDLGFTAALTPGARVSGLAGAYTSVADDAHALIYNPAGLARMRRIEVALGLQRQHDDLRSTFLGNSNQLDLTSSTLDYVTGVYPVATYRGSFVVAFGVYRVMSADLDIVTRGSSTVTTTNGNYHSRQSGDAYSYNLGAGIDLSPYLSIGFNLFVLDGAVERLTQFSFDLLPRRSGEPERQSVLDDTRGDLDGFGAAIGFQLHPHPLLRLGLLLQLPTLLNFNRVSAVETSTLF